jgi:pyrimidine deaminase RibD-like protein
MLDTEHAMLDTEQAMPDDASLMRRALALAARGAGYVEPNPMVGCVIVARGGKVVGEGWHQRFGGPHAEVEALATRLSPAAAGATLYVTLEPCCHHGKTPPCAEAVIAAGCAAGGRRHARSVSAKSPAGAFAQLGSGWNRRRSRDCCRPKRAS